VVVLTNRYVDLVEEGFDLAIRTGALPDSFLRSRHLGDSALVVAASPACLARWGVLRARRDFERLPCLVLGEETEAARWVFVEGGRRVSVRVRPAVVSNDMDLLRHAALAGVGYAMLPGFLLAQDLASGALRAAEGDRTLQRGEVHAVYAGPASPAARAIVRFLRERLASLPHWSRGRGAEPGSRLPEV
jgi:DNA-binding transcriptional LysR family regulator